MGHHHHTHEHSKNLGVAFGLNLLFTIIEVAGGIWTNSLAILSDALHDFGDCLALGLAWYLQRISNRRRDQNYSYGYKRFSTLGALINAVILLVGCTLILREAIPRLLHPELPHTPGMMMLAVLGVLINGVAASFLHHGHSLNEKTAYFHLIEDVMGWIVVLIGSIIMYYKGWSIIDPILSILIAIYIFYNAVKYLRQTAKVFLQRIPESMDTSQLTSEIKSIPGIKELHDLHVWSLDGEYHILTAHIVASSTVPKSEWVDLKRKIKARLAGHGIGHATLEFEREGDDCVQ